MPTKIVTTPMISMRPIASPKMKAERINPNAGVSESALMHMLLQLMTQHHPPSDGTQVTEWMAQQIAQYMRVAHYGTLTAVHVFADSLVNGRMNGN